MGTKSPRHIIEAVLDTYLTAESGLAGVAVYTGDNAEINVLPSASSSAMRPAPRPSCPKAPGTSTAPSA